MKTLQTIQNTKEKTKVFGSSLIAAGSLATLATLSSAVLPIFAASDPQTVILNVINSLGSILTTIFPPLCVLILGFCIIGLMMGRSSKSAENSLSWAKRAVGGFIGFNCLGLILEYGTKLFAGQGFNFG